MEQPISSDIIRGHIDSIILFSLKDNDKFAQQISDFIDSKSDNLYQINQATLYSSLKRLESLKYVVSYWQDSEQGRRKFFKITESGELFLTENVNGWNNSKTIIDKLISNNKINEIKTDFNVKNDSNIDYVTHNDIENVQKKPNDIDIEYGYNDNSENDYQENQNSIANQENHDINYKVVLTDLLSNVRQDKTDDEIINKKNQELLSPVLPNVDEKPIKFNDQINELKSMEKVKKEKIDFSDLITLGKQNGYNIRVSSKYSAKSNGNLFINKIRLYVSVILFVLMELELFSLYFIKKEFLTANFIKFGSLICLVSPLIFSIIYFLRPRKVVSTKITFDGVLTSLIIVFNLCLITVAFSFLKNIDLTVYSNILHYLIIPIILYLNLVIYYLIKKLLSNFKIFYINN